MATKSFRFPVTIGVADKSEGTQEVRDTDGTLLFPATMGLRYILPGEPVEMDEVEGAKLLARHGPYVGAIVEVTSPPTMPRQTLGAKRP